MASTKAAAILALLAAIVAAGWIVYELYENVLLDRAAIDGLNGIGHSQLLEYGLPGGIAVAALITSLVLFGSAKAQKS